MQYQRYPAARDTYCKVRCEGDRSCPVYATAEKEGGEDAAVFEGSPEVIFIVLHSDAHVMLKVRDRREGGFFRAVRRRDQSHACTADHCACYDESVRPAGGRLLSRCEAQRLV